MALLTKKEFAHKCGMPTNQLSVAVGRDKKVILREDGLIDDAEPTNALFFEMRQMKGKTIPKGLAPMPVFTREDRQMGPVTNVQINNSSPSEFLDLERQLKEKDLEKRKEEIIQLQLKNEKTSGSVVPLAVMQPLLMEYNRLLVNSYRYALDEFLTTIGKVAGLDNEQISWWRGEIVKTVNEASDKGITETIRQLQNIIIEYSNTRGAGERT